MSDPFSQLEPGDLIEVPPGYIVSAVRHPLVRWEEKHGGHYAYLGDHVVTIVSEQPHNGGGFRFKMDICLPFTRYGHPTDFDEIYCARTLKRAKHMVETMVEKWVTAAGLIAGQTVYYTRPTDDDFGGISGGVPGGGGSHDVMHGITPFGGGGSS